MAISISSITRRPVNRAVRNLVLGGEKVGKSTFCNGKPGTVFLPVKGEEGIDALNPMAFPTAHTYADVLDAIRALYSEDHNFSHFAIDSASSLEPIIWDAVCRAHNVEGIERVLGGFGKGYVEALRWWREITDGLDALRNDRGMTVSIIGHCKVKTFNDPGSDPYDTWVFDVQDRAAAHLRKWADCTLFAAAKHFTTAKSTGGDKKTTHALGSGERVLYTQKRPHLPAGCRWPIPHELPLEYAAYERELFKSQDVVEARNAELEAQERAKRLPPAEPVAQGQG